MGRRISLGVWVQIAANERGPWAAEAKNRYLQIHAPWPAAGQARHGLAGRDHGREARSKVGRAEARPRTVTEPIVRHELLEQAFFPQGAAVTVLAMAPKFDARPANAAGRLLRQWARRCSADRSGRSLRHRRLLSPDAVKELPVRFDNEWRKKAGHLVSVGA